MKIYQKIKNFFTRRKWKVGYNSGFWSSAEKYRDAGRCIPVGKKFKWENEKWNIPAVYVCREGLVIDFCVEKENNIDVFVMPKIEVNGDVLQYDHGCGAPWFSPNCLEEDLQADESVKKVLEHYGLDLNRGWSVHRYSFKWKSDSIPKIRSLRLHLERYPIEIGEVKITTNQAGNEFSFSHPVTGEEHILTVQDYEVQTIDRQCFNAPDMEYPTHYIAMTYTLSPDIAKNVQLRDCCEGDRPRRKKLDSTVFEPDSSCSIGIIGGADGPTMLLLGTSSKKLHTACSSLYFEPKETVEWELVFREKMFEDITVEVKE